MKFAIPLEKFKFYPDKPTETTLSCLKRYDNGRHCAVSKVDGYNLFMCNNGGVIEAWSRKWKKLPVCDEIIEMWKSLTKDKIPDNSIINCEWMKFRAGSGDFVYDGPECIYLLTPYVLDGLFVGSMSYVERRSWLESLEVPIDDISITESSKVEHRIMLPAKVDSGFEDFYNQHTKIPRTEGIVIYRNNGKLIANQNDSIKSKDMMKCKYRKGDSGRTEV